MRDERAMGGLVGALVYLVEELVARVELNETHDNCHQQTLCRAIEGWKDHTTCIVLLPGLDIEGCEGAEVRDEQLARPASAEDRGHREDCSARIDRITTMVEDHSKS